MAIIPDRFTGSPHVVLMKQLIENAITDINTTSLGKVTNYNKVTGRASIQILNKLILDATDETGKFQSLDIPVLDNIPVCFFGSPKTLKLTYEVQVGDTGLLIVCQRSADEFKSASMADPENPSKIQSYQQKDTRKFDINDAMFFPIYFSGNKDFQGLEDTKSDSKLGVTEEGKMRLKGSQMEMTEVVSDLQSQVNTNAMNIKAVASTPWTAPSLGTVIPQEIIAKIKHASSFIKQNTSFQQASFEVFKRSLFSAGLKALDVIIKNGMPEIRRETPEQVMAQMNAIPKLEVVVRQMKFSQDTFLNYSSVYGWCLKGLNSLDSYFPNDGRGMGDFSPLSRVDKKDLNIPFEEDSNNLIFSNLVAFFQWIDSSVLNLGMYWVNDVDLRKSSIKRIRIFVQDHTRDDPEFCIASFLIPQQVTAKLTGIEIYRILIENDTADVTALNDGTAVSVSTYFENNSTFGSLFGSDNDLVYPALTLSFYDASDKPITVPME